MKKVVFCGASSVSNINNFGDELLRDLYMLWAKEVCSDLKPIFLKYHGFISSKKNWEVEVSEANAFVFNGGGYFGEKPFLNDGKVSRLAKKIAWGARNDSLYGRAFNLVKKHSVPLLVSGVEIGPITNPIFKKRVSDLINYSSYCCVRNKESYDNALKMCGDKEKVNMEVDSAMSLCESDIRKMYPRDADVKIRKSADAFNIGVHVHELGKHEYNDIAYFSKLIEKVASYVTERKINVFYMHDQKINGTHPPRSLNSELAFKKENSEIQIVSYENPGQLLNEINGLDFLITTKLHLGIVSRALSIPVISCPSHVIKTKRFYSYIGESDYCSDRGGFDKGIPQRLEEYLISNSYIGFPVLSEVKSSAENSKEKFKEHLGKILS